MGSWEECAIPTNVTRESYFHRSVPRPDLFRRAAPLQLGSPHCACCLPLSVRSKWKHNMFKIALAGVLLNPDYLTVGLENLFHHL